MNIVEAFKTGLPVQRAGKMAWIGLSPLPGLNNYRAWGWIDPQFLLSSMYIQVEDIIADDWIVKTDQLPRIQTAEGDQSSAHLRGRPLNHF